MLLLADFSYSPSHEPQAFLPFLLPVVVIACLALTSAAMSLRWYKPRRLLPIGILCFALLPMVWWVREGIRSALVLLSFTLLAYFAPEMEKVAVIPSAAAALWALSLGAWCIRAGLKARGVRGTIPVIRGDGRPV